MVLSILPDLGKRTLVMGILHVTPDSFSYGGRYSSIETALAHARRMTDEGADILDVGGESTRPGATEVSAEEEMARVVPVIERLVASGVPPVSIDTYKTETAEAALSASAHAWSESGSRNGTPWSSVVVSAAPSAAPA